MEYRYNDLKEFLIRNGIKEVVGVANNKRIVYTYKLGLEYNGIAINDYYFNISYDGLKADVKRYGYCYSYIRYNETTDCIQGTTNNYCYNYSNKLKWKTLTFDKDGRLKTAKGFYDCRFLNVGESNNYCNEYYSEHINDAIRIIHSNIKAAKSSIKEYEKKIKNYENKLKELEKL